MSITRRFIAGAVCPRCQQLDKLFVVLEASTAVCECVNCGFRDARDRAAEPGTAEYRKGLGEPVEAVSVVRIVEPG